MSALIRWSPFLEPFEEMEKFLSDVPAVRQGQSGYVPAVDMYEEKDDVIIEAQLAGIDPENVDISIENDVVCIKGMSEKKSEVEDKNYYRKEIRRGSFYRSIPLPMHVAGDEATAIAEDGVLKITIPKAAEAKPKTIKIQTKKK
jgi:HSP20 family protein